MEKITIHNYEAYLLDLIEGNLTPNLQVELELFLMQHPELSVNLSDLDQMPVLEAEHTFINKEHLKKKEHDLISENQFIAYIEKQLTTKEKQDIEKSITLNLDLKKELYLFQNTITTADVNIVYPNKEELKRSVKIIAFTNSFKYLAVAASVLFLIGLFMVWPSSTLNNAQSLAFKINSELKYKQASVKTKTIRNNVQPHSQPQQMVAYQNNNSKIKNNTPNKNEVVTPPITNDFSKTKDTTSKLAINTNSVVIDENKTATTPKSTYKTTVEVITENDTDVLASKTEKPKKGLWNIMTTTLKNLKTVGVKGVDGKQDVQQEKQAFALKLGGINITHKSAN